MQINRAQILRALIGMPTPSTDAIDEYVASFNMWAVYFGIDTPKRVAAYLSQTLHESQLLKRTEENLNYSADGLLKTFPKYFKTREQAEAYARNPQKIANRVPLSGCWTRFRLFQISSDFSTTTGTLFWKGMFSALSSAIRWALLPASTRTETPSMP